ncbi:D-alanine--D-alanine ligase [Aneurinibacillus terranovensis]|uniref:D-alanine--D-alanine ligase n=1 Tax=Aneurinibacillus terranovensis TaxID=278991 RepID=UPI0004188680|nr:D-alanine--D-alanine ligase [Aneurinibacillus terranovensis]
MSKQRLGIIYGGKSSEHEVSVHTALSIIRAVDRARYEVLPIYIHVDGRWAEGPWVEEIPEHVDQLRYEPDNTPEILLLKNKLDVVFPVIHGPNGEDGTLQGLLEMIDLPYVGSGVLASSLGMDKVMMKEVFANTGLPQGRYSSYLRSRIRDNRQAVCDEIEETLGFPCFIKPANMGSSIGISKAKDRASLEDALALAARFDRKVIVEEFINGREVEVGVLGNDHPTTSVVGEIIPENEFYDYQAKYKSSGTRLDIPANIPENIAEQIKELAVKAFGALGCSGLSRVDFFYAETEQKVYINEINTLPGFTPYSMYPMLWKQAGIEYAELIERLIGFALERYRERKENELVAESFYN